MSKKTFNPKDWENPTQNNNPTNDCGGVLNTPSNSNPNTDIEEITKRIESTATDITPNYADWRDLGFALADALGESGRGYYHRLSRFYPSYSQGETNKQYSACLASHGNGVTIKTLFHLAKQAGVNVSMQIAKYPNCQNDNLEKRQKQNTKEIDKSYTNNPTSLPTFPDEIYQNLPDFLQQITANGISYEEKDLLLLGSIVVLSSCMPNVSGIYGGVNVYPNLFLFVSAQASAGKGRLSLCRRLVEPIHRQLREINEIEMDEFKRKQAEYVANKKNPDAEQPQEPPLRLLFVPANSSATAVFQILNENEGVGLMFETEGDTLAQTFKSEHGNYSDGFRKAFHHEKISYLRRKDREYVTLETPKLSALLSGTPRQIQSLIPDAENGLFSRFIFYCMNIRLEWIDVFAVAQQGESLDQVFDRFGSRFFEFYQALKTSGDIRFSLSQVQQQEFNAYFEQTQLEYFDLCGKDYIGTVRRLGLITYRIALVLSTLRIMQTGCFSTPLVCDNSDFRSAMEMVKILVQHAAYVFHLLSPQISENHENSKKSLLHSLPEQFERTGYVSIAKQLNIPESTADKQIKRYLDANLIIRVSQNNYKKVFNN